MEAEAVRHQAVAGIGACDGHKRLLPTGQTRELQSYLRKMQAGRKTVW